MKYVESNEHIINCAYDSIGHDQVKSFFYSDFIDLMNKLITGAEERFDLYLEESYKDFLAKFYTEALSGMLMEWINKKNTIDKQSVVTNISSTIQLSLAEILNKLGKKKNSI